MTVKAAMKINWASPEIGLWTYFAIDFIALKFTKHLIA